MTAHPLILASTSTYRRELLGRLRLPFDVASPGVDEVERPGEAPQDRARRLATAKAEAVAAARAGAIVIGSDQVAALGSRILDKPGTAATAREQLTALSGRSAQFHTACVIIAPGGIRAVHVDRTLVRFRALSPLEIERYVATEQPLDCAGGFKVEALGISLFDAVETVDPTALIGLPLIWLAGALRGAGFAVP